MTNVLYISHLSHVCYMFQPSSPSWCNHATSTVWRVQILQLLSFKQKEIHFTWLCEMCCFIVGGWGVLREWLSSCFCVYSEWPSRRTWDSWPSHYYGQPEYSSCGTWLYCFHYIKRGYQDCDWFRWTQEDWYRAGCHSPQYLLTSFHEHCWTDGQVNISCRIWQRCFRMVFLGPTGWPLG